MVSSGSIGPGFLSCTISRGRIHDFIRTRPGFLSRWQLVLPISFKSFDLIILGTWSLFFDDHRREPIGKYLVSSGGCSFSPAGMVRTLDSLFTPTHFSFGGRFQIAGSASDSLFTRARPDRWRANLNCLVSPSSRPGGDQSSL